jgi:hypothetical protein
MKKAYKQIWKVIRKKSPLDKDTLKNKTKINTFYGSETLGDQNKRFNNTHFILKYKLIVPAMILVKKWIDKKFKKDNEKRIKLAQFEYVKLFDEAFDEASTNWRHKYIQSLFLTDNLKTLDEVREEVKEGKGPTTWLQMAKEVMKTILMNDDAYAEWLPFFLVEIHKRMNELIKDKEYNGKVFHLMHTVPSHMDLDYEMVYLRLKMIKNFEASVVGNQGGEIQSAQTTKPKKE